MRWALRLLPASELRRRYLEGGDRRCGGFWYDEPLLAGHRPFELRRALQLEWVTSDGAVAFPAVPELGALRFPVDHDVLVRSAIACTRAFSGALPDSPAGGAWRGNGFVHLGGAPIPEYRMRAGLLPDRSEAGRIDHRGRFVTLARLVRDRWHELGPEAGR